MTSSICRGTDDAGTSAQHERQPTIRHFRFEISNYESWGGAAYQSLVPPYKSRTTKYAQKSFTASPFGSSGDGLLTDYSGLGAGLEKGLRSGSSPDPDIGCLCLRFLIGFFPQKFIPMILRHVHAQTEGTSGDGEHTVV